MRAEQVSSGESVHGNPYHWYPMPSAKTEEDAAARSEAQAEVLYDVTRARRRPRKQIAGWRYALVGAVTAAAAVALVMLGTGRGPRAAAAMPAARPAVEVVTPAAIAPAPAVPTPAPAPAPTATPDRAAPVAVARPTEAPRKPAKISAGDQGAEALATEAPRKRTEQADDGEAETIAEPTERRIAGGSGSAALLRQYQRVGRDLMMLENSKGAFAVKELVEAFREIKIDEAQATSESRTECEETLREIQGRIERHRGVQLSQECLNNPLAADCQ
jgi:hypothetical protein